MQAPTLPCVMSARRRPAAGSLGQSVKTVWCLPASVIRLLRRLLQRTDGWMNALLWRCGRVTLKMMPLGPPSRTHTGMFWQHPGEAEPSRKAGTLPHHRGRRGGWMSVQKNLETPSALKLVRGFAGADFQLGFIPVECFLGISINLPHNNFTV